MYSDEIVFDQLKKTIQIEMHQSIAPLVFLAPNVSLRRGFLVCLSWFGIKRPSPTSKAEYVL
jgi:hypothetical protein